MLYLILAALLLTVIFGPQLWASHILRRYSKERPDLAGTGGELASHLIQRFQLQGVTAEATVMGDHYDPAAKAVRLQDNNFHGKSLTAVATAAHEIGHAIQHHQGYRPLLMRSTLAGAAMRFERLGSAALLVAPLVIALAKAPAVGLLFIGFMVFTMLITSLVHLVTLPVEWDASFGKALPLLQQGHYVAEADLKAVRQILTACALTYVASSLAGLLNLWRWLRVLRR